MAKLRLGVIGAGSWAVASHLPNFAKRADDVEFVGVCRKGPELLGKIKDDWGFAIASEDYWTWSRPEWTSASSAARTACTTSTRRPPSRRARTCSARSRSRSSRSTRGSWSSIAERKDRHLLICYGWNYLPWMQRGEDADGASTGSGRSSSRPLQMASVCRELLANLGEYPGAAPETVPEQATWTDPSERRRLRARRSSRTRSASRCG